MKLEFSRKQEIGLLVLSIIGLLGPNGLFIWATVVAPESVGAAMGNPVAQVFMVEAFVLMFLFAYLIARQGLRSPGWMTFVLMSLVGSMMFSVPACLYLWSRRMRGEGP